MSRHLRLVLNNREAMPVIYPPPALTFPNLLNGAITHCGIATVDKDPEKYNLGPRAESHALSLT